MARLPTIKLSTNTTDAPSIVPMFSGTRRVTETVQRLIGGSTGDVPVGAVEYTFEVVAGVSRTGAVCRVSLYSEDGSEVAHVVVSGLASGTLSTAFGAPLEAGSYECRARLTNSQAGDYCLISGASVKIRWS